MSPATTDGESAQSGVVYRTDEGIEITLGTEN